MGFLDELKKMTRPYDDDDEFFDDEDEAIPVAEAPAPERPAPARPARRTAPAAKQSSFIRDNPVSEPVREPERPAPGYTARSDSRVADKVVNLNSGGQLKVVLVAPKQFELAAEIADHLRDRRAVLMNLEQTDKNIARRLIDFLSGVAYAQDGKIRHAVQRRPHGRPARRHGVGRVSPVTFGHTVSDSPASSIPLERMEDFPT